MRHFSHLGPPDPPRIPGHLGEPATPAQAQANNEAGRVAAHLPRRDDDVAAWIKRERDRWPQGGSGPGPWEALDRLLDRYRECADYGLTLRREDDEAGDP